MSTADSGAIGCDVSIFADHFGDGGASTPPDISGDLQTDDVPTDDPLVSTEPPPSDTTLPGPDPEPEPPTQDEINEALAETKRRSIVGLGAVFSVGMLLFYLNRIEQ